MRFFSHAGKMLVAAILSICASILKFYKTMRFLAWLFDVFVVKTLRDGKTHILLEGMIAKDASFLRRFVVLIYAFFKLVRVLCKEELRLLLQMTLFISIYAILLCRLLN